MEYRHEIIDFGESIPVKFFVHQLGYSGLHWHNSLELLFVVSGSVHITVAGHIHKLSAGDVILINANAPHELNADECIMAAVQIKLSLFDERVVRRSDLYFNCNSVTDPSNPGLPKLKRIVAQFVKIYADSDEGRTMRAKSLSYSLMAELMTCFRARLKKDFYRITCGFTGAPLMLPVLLENGMTDVAYRMLLSEEFPGWLYAVNLGATTIWERWNSLEADGAISGTGMNSLNHYAYGSVCEAVFAYICGLQNAAPGWTKARIAPKLNGRIRNADIRFDSPAGQWAVSWRIADDGKVTLSATIPEGASAEVVLPDHPEQLTLAVTGGTYTQTYQPAVDQLHPFSAQSMMMELLENEAAVALLQEKAPGILGMAMDPASEFRVESPIGVAFAMPFLDPADAFTLDPLLNGIHI